MPMVIVGTFILAFGWFGFNPGSTLAGVDLRISVVVVDTMLAGIVGAIAAMLTMYAKGFKPDPSMICNGILAGLVAITAPCAFVDSWAAVVIGGIAGAVVVVFGFAMAYAWFKLSNLIFPIRVSAETEMAGLDAPEMGALGYPDFSIAGRN